MRLGRIILAILAPLVSLPVLPNGSARDQLPPATAADSLLNLLRSVVPVVAAAADSETHATAHAVPTVWPIFTCLEEPVALASAEEADLLLLIRQQHRFLLRC